MKLLLLGICFLATIQFVSAQLYPKGKITDARTGAAVAGATIEISGIGSSSSNENGFFELRRIKPGNYQVKVTSIGYKTFDSTLYLNGKPIAIALFEVPLF